MNLERADTSSLTIHLKYLEQKEENTTKRSRQQEIIKLRAEINQVETKRTIQRIFQTGRSFFEKINKIDKPIARLSRGHRDSTLINKTRNQKGGITTETEVIQKNPQILLKKKETKNKKPILNKTGKSWSNGQFSRQIPYTKVKSGSDK